MNKYHAEHKAMRGNRFASTTSRVPCIARRDKRADPETGPRAHVSLRRSLPAAYAEVLQLVQQRRATYGEYVLRRSATAASVRD